MDVAYLLDRSNGATMLTIPFGHAVDALCHTLGEFTTLSATTATRRPSARASDGTSVPMTAQDQVAVVGTEGDVVVRGSSGHLQYGRVEVLVGRPGGERLLPSPVPDRFVVSSALPYALGHTVAEAYVQIAHDLRTGSRLAPTFADGARRHHLLMSLSGPRRRDAAFTSPWTLDERQALIPREPRAACGVGARWSRVRRVVAVAGGELPRQDVRSGTSTDG